MSIIDKKEGLYDPTKRFAFTNVLDENFTSQWNSVPVTVKPKETIEISNVTPIPGAGHALAVKMVNEMVDKIMMGEAKIDEVEKNQPYYRSPKGMSLGVPVERKVFEDQIIRELDPDEESPTVQTLRNQLREEILTGKDEKQSVEPVHIPTSISEFADLNQTIAVETPKKSAKVKVLKTS